MPMEEEFSSICNPTDMTETQLTVDHGRLKLTEPGGDPKHLNIYLHRQAH